MESDSMAGAAVYCMDGKAGVVQDVEYDRDSGELSVLTVDVADLGEVRMPAGMIEGSSNGELWLHCSVDELRRASEVTRGLHDYYVSVSGEGRPLWHRAAATLEPLRPAFTWLVEHEDVMKVAGFAFFLGFGSFVSYAAGQRVGALMRRRG